MWAESTKEGKGCATIRPMCRRRTSEYSAHTFRFTIPTLDAPRESLHLAQILEQCGAEDLLLYASDYPHSHDRQDFLLDLLTADQREKIDSANARTFYRL